MFNHYYFVIASVHLISSGIMALREDIHCPGDSNVTYNCFIESNSENMYLEWELSPPGRTPIRIMYGSDNTSELNVPRMLDSIGSVMFTNYTAPQDLGSTVDSGYIESTLIVILFDVSLNGIAVKCATDIANATELALFNTSGEFSTYMHVVLAHY